MTDIFLKIADAEFMLSLIVAVATFATIVTIAMPYLKGDKLNARLNAVANRRQELRAKQKAELETSTRGRLREKPKSYMKRIVEQFNMESLLDANAMKNKLYRAGFRGQKPLVTFMFFRLVAPFIVFGAAMAYQFVFDVGGPTTMMKVAISFGAAFAGFYLPNVFVENLIARRQDALEQSFPDALDLLLICIEAGMSIEAAFNKVATEIGQQSVEMAEEMSLTTAELSYLQERRTAYENLAERTGLAGVKAVCTSLIQAERYGTPLAQALRVMAQENRDIRTQVAEKKAAALPAKLTVPMIVFFLPVLFVVIMGPAGMKLMAM